MVDFPAKFLKTQCPRLQIFEPLWKNHSYNNPNNNFIQTVKHFIKVLYKKSPILKRTLKIKEMLTYTKEFSTVV